MLLDRRRINKWAKWVSLGLALVFAISFIFLGVGSGTGLNWSDLFGGGSNAVAQDPEGKIKQFEETLAQNPNDVNALLGIANQYSALDQPAQAAIYLERLITVQPDRAEVYERLGRMYNNELGDPASAVRVLRKATELDPANADAFLQLGIAERSAGNTNAAILAWNRYLQLEPDGTMADTVKKEIEQLTPSESSSTTTTTAKSGG